MLKIATFNAQSLVCPVRQSELDDLLLQNHVNICLLQETFYKSTHKGVELRNYKLYRTDRVGRRGGGTAIAVERNLEVQVVPIQQLARLVNIETTAIMVKLDGRRKLFCVSLYNRRANLALRENSSGCASTSMNICT